MWKVTRKTLNAWFGIGCNIVSNINGNAGAKHKKDG
jgi:hypothetical protein